MSAEENRLLRFPGLLSGCVPTSARVSHIHIEVNVIMSAVLRKEIGREKCKVEGQVLLGYMHRLGVYEDIECRANIMGGW